MPDRVDRMHRDASPLSELHAKGSCAPMGAESRSPPSLRRLDDETDLHAAVVPALVVDLEDTDSARAPGRCEMRAAARLAIEPDDLDDAHAAVRGGRGRHRAAADQTGLGRERL